MQEAQNKVRKDGAKKKIKKPDAKAPQSTNEAYQGSELAAPYSKGMELGESHQLPCTEDDQKSASPNHANTTLSQIPVSLEGSLANRPLAPSPVSSSFSFDIEDDVNMGKKLKSKGSFQVTRTGNQNKDGKKIDNEPSEDRQSPMSTVSSNISNLTSRGTNTLKELLPSARKERARAGEELLRHIQEEEDRRGRLLQRAQNPARTMPITRDGSPTEIPNLGHVNLAHTQYVFNVTNPDLEPDDGLLGYFAPMTGVSTAIAVTTGTVQQIETEARAERLSQERAKVVERMSGAEFSEHFAFRKPKYIAQKSKEATGWEKNAAARMFGSAPAKVKKPDPIRRTVTFASDTQTRRLSPVAEAAYLAEFANIESSSNVVPSQPAPSQSNLPRALQAGVKAEPAVPEGVPQTTMPRRLGQMKQWEEEEHAAGGYAQGGYWEQPLGTPEGARRRVEKMEEIARRIREEQSGNSNEE